jgi:hypothetical protein
MTLPLMSEMPEYTWPWMTEVEDGVDRDYYGNNLCGELRYEVLYIDESVAPSIRVPTDLIKIQSDSGSPADAYLLFQPLLID